MSDTIGDMLTIIRNGYLARLKSVTIPHSKMKLELGKTLVKSGYLSECGTVEINGRTVIKAVLRYVEKLPAMSQIVRVSKPGRRVYARCSEIKAVVGGKGITIISTPKGLMNNKEARKLKLGGEIVCQTW